MPSTFSLAANPKWYFLDAFGEPAAGGTIETFSSLDHSTPKFVFSDPAGLFPYTDPILLDVTGGSPVPMYWENNGVDLYYVIVRDAPGNIIFTIDNFPTNTGGVTPITSNVDIENHLVNGQFLFIDAVNDTLSLVNNPPIGETRVAPGSGFYKDASGSYVNILAPGGGFTGWIFQKAGGAGSTDSIRFVAVATLGAGFPNEPSANATRFFRYQFSALSTPLTEASLGDVIPNVERFSGETITVSFDSRTNVLGAQGVFRFEQHFGTGGGSPTITTSQIFTFSSPGFARQSFTFTVPSVIGKTKGTGLDDHIYIAWQFPLNVVGTFDLANLQVQLGTFGLVPYIQQTYAQDQYKVLLDLLYDGNILFRTGELKWLAGEAAVNTPIVIPGWLAMRDKTVAFIGSTASVAVNKGVQYFNLYSLWWTSYPQTECIVSGGRGVSAIADFNANKTMTIPQHILGTVLVGAGNGIVFGNFGAFEGERTHVLTIPEMPSHTHTVNAQFTDINVESGGAGACPRASVVAQTGPTGGGGAHNNMQPTFYMWVYVKI